MGFIVALKKYLAAEISGALLQEEASLSLQGSEELVHAKIFVIGNNPKYKINEQNLDTLCCDYLKNAVDAWTFSSACGLILTSYVNDRETNWSDTGNVKFKDIVFFFCKIENVSPENVTKVRNWLKNKESDLSLLNDSEKD